MIGKRTDILCFPCAVAENFSCKTRKNHPFRHHFRTLSLSKCPENTANILFSGCQAIPRPRLFVMRKPCFQKRVVLLCLQDNIHNFFRNYNHFFDSLAVRPFLSFR